MPADPARGSMSRGRTVRYRKLAATVPFLRRPKTTSLLILCKITGTPKILSAMTGHLIKLGAKTGIAI